MASDRAAVLDTAQTDVQAPPAVVKDPPGVQALRALLQQGVPDPAKVVEIIDTHRSEHDALFALLQQTLGNAYVQKVVQTMDHLRLSIPHKELAAGDPSDPNAGYFLASQELQGAKWRTANGGFTGSVDKKGLDTTVKVDKDDAIHAKINADKTGTVAWEHDGKNEGELYGRYGSGKDYEVGLRRTQDAFGGSMTEGVRHKQTASGTVDEAYGSYKSKDGATELQGAAGVANGKFEGNLSGSHKFGDHDTLTGSVAHDEKGTTASLSEHHKLKGGAIDTNVSYGKDGTSASISGEDQITKDTKVSGKVGVDKGDWSGNASVTHKIDDNDTITGTVAGDKKGASLTLAEHHALKNGSIDTTFQQSPDGTTFKGSFEDQLSKNTKVSGSLGSEKGQFVGNGTVVQKLGEHDTLTGTIAHDKAGTTGSLLEHHQLKDGFIDTKLARTTDATSLSISGQDQISKELSVNGSLSHEHKDKGGDQTSLTLGEKYRSGNVVQSLDLNAGVGTRNYFNTTGSLDAKLAPNLYGGAWGSFGVEGGHHSTAQLGASLTFTPQEKTALTLAGVVDEHGTLETRLQLDVFKDKLNGVGDIADHKKDALLSLFLSYSTHAGHAPMLDNRFGAPQFGTTQPAGGGQVTAGIKIRF